jgi:indole-3-glycerol phosphate synthase/phosphoribosylanthranilate isomerase
VADVLAEIVARKRQDVTERLKGKSIESMRVGVAPTGLSLKAALAQPGARFIMEMKRTSPSRGASAGHEPAEVARAYAGAADAMSVLTDAPYFGGSFEDLAEARSRFAGPVLCKDFTVDPRQIAEARGHGADAVLIMLSVLDDAEAAQCLGEARHFGMDALVEVHDEAELRRALALGAQVIGINNRNLKTLEIDLAVTERLAPMVPTGAAAPLLVSESGIATRADVERLAPLVDAFLVGSSLMADPDIAGAARRLAFGRVKVCGLTREEDVRAAHAEGASYGGMIFAPESPRRVMPEHAEILAATGHEIGLSLVGVFQDASESELVWAADRFDLAAVQLHGCEDEEFVGRLRERLPADCEIWAAAPVGPAGLVERETAADRLIFDTSSGGRSGGTGISFDWGRVADHPALSDALLAGGLGPHNAAAASRVGAWALDVNSGVEESPGIKSPDKLGAFFEALRPAVRSGGPSC